MPDRNTSIRHWQLVRFLASSRNGCSVRELSREFQASEKTMRRDLAAIAAAGLPLAEATGSHGRKSWRLERGDDLPAPSLDVSEAAALSVARRFLEPLAGTALWDAAQSAFLKLRQLATPQTLSYVETLARAMHQTTFGHSDYSTRANLIDDLMTGVRESRVVNVLYQPLRSETPENYLLHPVSLVWHRGTLYLVAVSADRDEPRHFKLDRIRDVDVLDEEFTAPAFDLTEHLQNTLGVYQKSGPVEHVRIRFSPDVARYVTEHRWHASQQIDEQPDGSLLVEFTLTDLTEFKSWILGFGSQAQVLEPQSLRAAIRDEIRALHEMYGIQDDRRSQTGTSSLSE